MSALADQATMSDGAIGDGATRAARIRQALASLAPLVVELIDESHKHVGHAGARDGRGHFALRIVGAKFSGQNAVARHRTIYAALGNLMQTDIHALSIKALTPAEASNRR